MHPVKRPVMDNGNALCPMMRNEVNTGPVNRTAGFMLMIAAYSDLQVECDQKDETGVQQRTKYRGQLQGME